MKLFTKEIDTKLFEQYLTGSDLENQMVVAKIFNPYGRGTWYLLNSDPEDAEYLWAIVDMDDIEVGSVNRSDLENIRIKPFMLGLERDLSFRQMNALELYEGLNEGKKYIKGGGVEKANFGYLLIADKMKNLAPKSFDAVDEKFAERIKIGMYADGGGVGDDLRKRLNPNINEAINHFEHTSVIQQGSKLDLTLRKKYGNFPQDLYIDIDGDNSFTLKFDDRADAFIVYDLTKSKYADGGEVEEINQVKIEIEPQYYDEKDNRKNVALKYDVNYLITFNNKDFIELTGTLKPYHTGRDYDYEFEVDYFADQKEEDYYEKNSEKIQNEILDKFYSKKATGGGIEAENKEMVLNNNKQIAHHTKEISAAVKNAKNVPAWVVAKVNRSATDLSDATHYMEGQGESYADGGGIGFIPMDLEEKLAIIAKWGGTNIKGVIGILNAMIDSGLTNNDLKPKPTKNTRFQIERATEKKIQEIWKEIKPNYKGNFEGNKYYSTLKEMISRNWIYEDVLAKFKPFRKYQKPIYADGGGVGDETKNWFSVKFKLPDGQISWTTTYSAMGEKYAKSNVLEDFGALEIIEIRKATKNEIAFKDGGIVGEKWQIKDSNDKYFSVSMQTGNPVWNESPDLGYSYEKQEAEKIKDKLVGLGTKDLKVVEYNPNWWKMKTGGGVGSKVTGWKHKKK